MTYVKVKECLTNPRQLVKLILVVVCVCITIFQLSECVSKILEPPITSYYKFRHNTTIKYPAVTVCRRPSFKNELFPTYGMRSVLKDLGTVDAFKFFSFRKYTVEEFVNATSYSFEETIPIYGFKGSGMGENIIVRSAFYTTHGLCHTIIPKETADVFSVSKGYWLYLKHTDESKSKDSSGLSTSGFEIHIHDENVFKDDLEMDRNFLYVEHSESMLVTLTVQTYSKISTSQEPCEIDATYSKSKCEEKCLHNFIAKAMGCTVPWLRHLEEDYVGCSNASAMNEVNKMFGEFRRNSVIKGCHCPMSCNSSIYNYHIESRRNADTLQAPSSTASIYFSSNLITDLTEVIGYDWNNFLSDVGGSLGFLLGLSVIGIVNVIEEVFKMIFRRNHPEKENLVADDQKLPYLNTVSSSENLEGESLKSVMEFVANCDMYQHNMQQNKLVDEKKPIDEKY